MENKHRLAQMRSSQISTDSTDTSRIWAVLPVFNNKDTVFDIASRCRRHLEHVLVVDDGSTDADIEKLFAATDIKVIRHVKNLGKGMAIRSSLQYLLKEDAKFVFTIDADGQHNPDDILRFIPLLKDNGSAIIVGARDFNSHSIPAASRFGRAFSNFWLRLETGLSIDDSQSGFRAYPVKHLSQIKVNGRHYDFEAEVLTRAAWSGLELKQVAIGVFYPQAQARVSNFRPLLDNLRLTLTHMRLIGRRLLPLPYPRLVEGAHREYAPSAITHPVKLLKALLKESSTPALLAVSAAVGMLLGVLPLLSVHILAVVYVTSRLHLNKIMAVAVQNLCMPPFVPALCIELGHFILYRQWLTDFTWKAMFGEIPKRLLEWLLGALVLAPVLAVITGVVVFFACKAIQKRDLNVKNFCQETR